ncbi:S8 family peptidase [Actinokineospora iranica]|uniref:Serine protease, subtilisin family n=1 Tax=Actinokineospora iranica TaxID=1271860 RepID=A0A1G6RFI1_9PSEU|nr:S8 family serine peptidase [Actinokineospora iranica]SDD02785.1 Serine protease, subtilisin family [Actinokineospora iranica]
MKRRKTVVAALAVPLVVTLSAVVGPGSATAQPDLSGKTVEFNILTADGASVESVEAAVRAAGGTVVAANRAAGLVTATAPENGFTARLAGAKAVDSAARAKSIGQAPRDAKAAGKAVKEEIRAAVEQEHKLVKAGRRGPAYAATAGMDPLDGQLWGLTSVRSHLARTKQAGDKRVKVGVLDTGVDASHPDIAPNFDHALSRNFTRDIPTDETGAVVDGPCEYRGCVDPADVDHGGHGTHVAGTIAAAADGFGISGVAPNVSIVNIRGGQDSGFFFLQPVVDAMTYSGDAGLDVVNMSFFVDPWLYNCKSNPADSAEQQAQQRITIKAISRAMNYAYRKGVTQVVSLGNQHQDLGAPLPDTISPNYPAGAAHNRVIDNADCLSLPVEGPHAIGVSSFGPSQAKADYSNYGFERISVSAPGGYFRDGLGTPAYRTNENLILSAYPKNVALIEGAIDEAGNITPDGEALGVQKACKPNGTCGYYQFLQGTSMASPHASGVAALIVAQYGKYSRGGVTLSADKVRTVLEGTAADIACPTPRTVDYTLVGRPAEFNATCEGTPAYNNFYGHGAVDAWAAVTNGMKFLR